MKYLTYDFVVADRSLVAAGKSFSFRTYTDRAGVFKNPGARVIYDDGSKDMRTQQPIGKSFSVGQSHYKLQAREGQEDYTGKSLYLFFLSTPFTEGSPNGDYVFRDGGIVPQKELMNREKNIERLRSGEITQLNVKIKLMDSEKDAEVALETGLKRAEAQVHVGQLDEQTLVEVASFIGVFGEPDMGMRLKVYEWAGKKPLDYFKLVETGDRPIRSLIRRGIDKGTLNVKGTVVYYNETILGADENEAVATLLREKPMLDALQNELKVEKKTKKK